MVKKQIYISLIVFLLVLFLLPITVFAASFNSTWNTSIAGASGVGNLALPLESSGTYDFTVYMGNRED